MKLSSHLFVLCIQITLASLSVSPSPIKHQTEIVPNSKIKCRFDNEILKTNSDIRLKRFIKNGSVWKQKIITWK